MSATKPKYRTPYVSVDAGVSLSEFGQDEIAEYLRRQGYAVYIGGGMAPANGDDDDSHPQNQINPDDLAHIETLALCGQMDAARYEALEMVSKLIGRTL